MKRTETISFTQNELWMIQELGWNRKILKKAVSKLLQAEYNEKINEKMFPNAREIIKAKWIYED